MIVFGFFSLVLTLVYWINRAVVLFDRLIADGQSARVFFEFTALSLPSVILLALPLASFAAAVYVTNRLSADSELVVVQATGYSGFRLARPVLYFGLIVAVLISILTHFLVPLSAARLAERQSELAQNVTSRLLSDGQFIEPIDGVTLYIREIGADGTLQDIFLSDRRSDEHETTYTAAEAFLVNDDGLLQLVMIDGMVQTLQLPSARLFRTQFTDFAFDISMFATTSTSDRRNASHLMTAELLHPTPALVAETGTSAARLVARAHERVSLALMGTVGALVGFSALLVGGFSRFGVWRQIIVAILLIILVKAVETTGFNLARSDVRLALASYTSICVGALISAALLFWSGRPHLFKRRKKGTA